MIVLGIEHCKFENKDGKQVNFDRVSLVRDIPLERGEGQAAEVVNVSPDKSAGLELGDNVEVLYNRFGKVSKFEIVS